MQANTPVQLLLWLIYPLAIYFGLQVLEPRVLVLVLTAALLVRRRGAARRLLSGLGRLDLAVLTALVAFAGLTAATNSETLLRLHPAAMNLGMLLLFGVSLHVPPSMVERFARLHEPDLPAEGVAYTRRVTQAWCAFFVANGVLATWTALYASRDVWALYNGLIAYLLMGAFFSIEWLVRRRVLARHRP